METRKCPVCLANEARYRGDDSDINHYECPRCGRFSCSQEFEEDFLRREVERDRGQVLLGPTGSRRRANLSSWLLGQPAVLLSSTDEGAVVTIPTPSIHQRAASFLSQLVGVSGSLGVQVLVKYGEWLSRTWSASETEVFHLLDFLEGHGWVSLSRVLGPWDHVTVTAEGWEQVEATAGSDSTAQGFVAMWFSEDMLVAYTDGIAAGIADAGYQPHRVDQKEYFGRIDDEIISQIDRSEFVVADFTGHRGGVYFEVGYAKGRNLPVFFCCRKDDLENLHFDVRQYNCIDWETPNELQVRLAKRILDTIGPGPLLTGVRAKQ